MTLVSGITEEISYSALFPKPGEKGSRVQAATSLRHYLGQAGVACTVFSRTAPMTLCNACQMDLRRTVTWTEPGWQRL